MIYVLDASTVLRLTDNEAGMARVRELLDDAGLTMAPLESE